jgi:hypothetical protein
MKTNKKYITNYEIFFRKSIDVYELLCAEYFNKINKAHDNFKKSAHYKFYYSINDSYQLTQINLGVYSRFFIDIYNDVEEDKNKKFKNEFNKKFDEIICEDKNKLLFDLILMNAQKQFINFLKNEHKNYVIESNYVTQNKINNFLKNIIDEHN